MKQSHYDRLLIKWAKDHYWDSLEKDRDLILRHLRTFVGDDIYKPETEPRKERSMQENSSKPILDDYVMKAIGDCLKGMKRAEYEVDEWRIKAYWVGSVLRIDMQSDVAPIKKA